jgi:hypothetical protein
MSDDEIRAALVLADTDDMRQLYLAIPWGAPAGQVLPLMIEAFETTKHSRARACMVHRATLFARIDERAVELGLRALADPIKEVRARACMLLAHSRKPGAVPALRAIKSGPTRELARRAVASIVEGEAFVPDNDPLYFFFQGDTGRAPRGSFADKLDAEIGTWLVAQGLHPSRFFAHAFVFSKEDLVVDTAWDGYEVEAVIRLTRGTGAPTCASVLGGPGDIAAIAQRMRTMLGG